VVLVVCDTFHFLTGCRGRCNGGLGLELVVLGMGVGVGGMGLGVELVGGRRGRESSGLRCTRPWGQCGAWSLPTRPTNPERNFLAVMPAPPVGLARPRGPGVVHMRRISRFVSAFTGGAPLAGEAGFERVFAVGRVSKRSHHHVMFFAHIICRVRPCVRGLYPLCCFFRGCVGRVFTR